MFKVEFIGNLGADVEIKNADGKKFAVCRIAHTEKWTGADNVEHTDTTWADVTINDTESKVIPFLKAGVKVFIRGNGRLRVYSSAKDRCMKAGISIQAWEIELCGGSSDAVPRQVIDPTNGQLYDVQKFYWIPKETKGMKTDELFNMVDIRGNMFVMNNAGFVAPVQPDGAEQSAEEKK